MQSRTPPFNGGSSFLELIMQSLVDQMHYQVGVRRLVLIAVAICNCLLACACNSI